MKIIVVLLTAFTLVSCKLIEVSKYEYHTTTMMGRTVLSITQDSVIVTFNGRSAPTRYARATKASEWTAINGSMKDVDLTKVNSLEAPSQLRATDAAPFATFYFETKDSTYKSATFDHKRAHEMLVPLMDEVLKVQEENKK